MADADDSKSSEAKASWGFKSLRRQSSSRWLFAASCLLLLIIVGPKLNAPFVWDDIPVIAGNDALAQAPLSSLVTRRYFDVATELSYRPLSTLQHWVGLKLFGAAPAGHRGLQLLMHLAVAGLIVAAFRRWGIADESAWLGGAVFALHPIHLETLFCVAFNEEILVAGFLLIAWIARMRFVDEDRPAWEFAAVAAFFLALLSKETALLALPALIVLEQLRPGDRRPPGGLSWLPYALVTLAYVFLRFGAFRGPQEAGAFDVSPSFGPRVLFAGQAFATALRAVLVPLQLRLEYFAVPLDLGDMVIATLGWAAALGLLIAAWNRREAAPGILWAALLLVPAVNLIPNYALTTRYFAERWLYVPLIGLLFAAAGVLSPARQASGGSTTPVRRGAMVLLVWLAICGGLESRLWTDERRLWSRMVEIYPWSAKAHEGLGEAYYRAGEFGEAVKAFETGMELRVDRKDKLLEYYIPLFEERAQGRPIPLKRETAYGHRWLARSWLALGRADQARGHLLRAEQLQGR